MKGTVKYVAPLRENKKGEMYRLATIKTEDGKDRKTYVVQGYKNEKNWTNLLVVGNILDNLSVSGIWVDADSKPEKVGFVEPVAPKKKEKVKKECEHPVSRETIHPDYRHCTRCNKPYKVIK